MRCPDRTSIIRYYSPGGASGEMSPEVRRALARHLASCDACARLGEMLAPAAGGLGAALAAPPPRCADGPDHATLADYLRDELPRQRRTGVRAHLLGCEACLRRSHVLAAALPRPEAGRFRGCATAVRRANWVPAAVALAACGIAWVALNGRPTAVPPQREIAIATEPRPEFPASDAGATPRLARAALSSNSPGARTALQPPRRTATVAPRPPRLRAARTSSQVRRARLAPRPAPLPEPEPAPNRTLVGAVDLELARQPEGEVQRSLTLARALLMRNRVDEATAVLEEVGGRQPRAVGRCLAMLYLARTYQRPSARRALSSFVEGGGPAADAGEPPALPAAAAPELDPAQLVARAKEAAPTQETRRTIERVAGQQEGGKLPPEALILAGIALDSPENRAESRLALRMAMESIE
jgi:hypothetical protein